MNAIKKLFAASVAVLAINFVAMLVAGAMLAQRAGVDRAKIEAVRDVLFPPETPVVVEPAAESVEPDLPTPMQELVALLDAQAGKPPEARVSDVADALDARTAALARDRRELADREAQVLAATRKLAQERAAFEAESKAWTEAVAAAQARAGEAGFAESLALLTAMPAKQAKGVLAECDDEAALRYLRAMEPRTAAKVLKEFNTPLETRRVSEWLEQMRQGDAAVAAASQTTP